MPEKEKIIRIQARFKQNYNSKQPFLKEVYWYDTFYKKAHTFNCSKLNFKSVEEFYLDLGGDVRVPVTKASKEDCAKFPIKKARRLVAEPYIYEVTTRKNTTDNNSLKDWFTKYHNYNNSKSEIEDENNYGISFLVPEKEASDFAYQLERNGFRYRVV